MKVVMENSLGKEVIHDVVRLKLESDINNTGIYYWLFTEDDCAALAYDSKEYTLKEVLEDED